MKLKTNTRKYSKRMTDTLTASEFNIKLKAGKLSFKKKLNRGESKLQIECVKWFRYQYPNLILFHIPNGGRRDEITAQIMKAEGVLPGVSDLLLMEPRNNFTGMFIEMKFDKNGLTQDQIKFFLAAEKRKYKCVVCKTVDSFMKEIETYLKLKS